MRYPRPLDIERIGREPELARGLLDRRRFPRRARIAGIGHHREMVEAGDRLAQDFQPLVADLARLQRQAGDVAAGMRQALDEAARDRIDRRGQHDRDRAGRAHHGGGRASNRHDHIDLHRHELGGDPGIAARVTLRPAIDEGRRASVDPAELAQALLEARHHRAPRRGSGRAKHGDGLAGRLRACRQRPCAGA